ncbi:hypothetical protein GCM10020331_077070 [Ectobacillus funiculus]
MLWKESDKHVLNSFFAYKMDDIDLIVAANRDEFYHRPTAPAHFFGMTLQMYSGGGI